MTGSDVRSLHRLIRSQDYETLKKYAEEKKTQWLKENPKADTEFETIWRLAYNQGKLRAMDEFFEGVETISEV